MTSEPGPVEGRTIEANPVADAKQAERGSSSSLSPAGTMRSAPAPTHAFDKEFDRLNDALANHSPQSFRSADPDVAHDEKKLEGWMRRVDKTLSNLRKRRSRRGKATR